MSAPGRREFLKAGAAAAGGLLLAVCLPSRLRGELAGAAAAPPADAFANAFLRIGTDGSITITVPRPEIGQGVRTALPMLVAEELEADWTRVRVEQADLDPERFGRDTQFSGGSNSVRGSWLPMRRAGAAAREMLARAAAERWGVDAGSCRAVRGTVQHAASGRRASYGELAAAAARLPVPAEPRLKDPSTFTVIGRRTRLLDAPAIVRGAARYGLDTRVPGMLYAVVERAPVFGARVERVDGAAALAVPGVRGVHVIDADAIPDFGENNPRPVNGVAVVADSTWAAMTGRRALQVRWSGGTAGESSERLRALCAEAARRGTGGVARSDGDVERALASAAHTLEAVYEVPFLSHAQMEPMNCTAHASAGRCEVWAPTQNPEEAAVAVGRTLGIAPSAVTMHIVRAGGGFGRRYYSDFVAEAALVSKMAGAPVQVVWTREDDLRHGFYRPAGYHVLRGGVDSSGMPVAWSHHLVNATRGDYLRWGPGEPGDGELRRDTFPGGFIPNYRLSHTPVQSAVPRGQWRAVADSALGFVDNGFLDELARLGGRDPLELRLAMLGPTRDVPYYSGRYNTGRLRRVLELAAERAGWGRALPAGRGLGIAACYANSAYCAHVAEVSVERATGAVRVHRVVSAIDCGTAVNPLGVEAQVEGSVAQGVSTVLHEAITAADGRVVQGNFHEYRLLRIGEMPSVEVHIIPGDGPPLGVGEGALPPAAPAVVNAIHAATGRRVRRLPLGTEVLRG